MPLPDELVLPGELLAQAKRAVFGVHSASFLPARDSTALVPRQHLRLYGLSKEASRQLALHVCARGTEFLRLDVSRRR